MAKPQTKKEKVVDDKLLTLPPKIGRAIIEAGALIACRLLGTDGFVTF